MPEERIRTEEININGEDLVATIKKLVHQGNIRRITIQSKDGNTLFELPLTLGVVGALFLPTLAALGALAAIVTECTILVERIDEGSTD